MDHAAAEGRPPRGWLDRFAARRASFCGVQAPPYLVLGVAGVAVAFVALVARSVARGFPLATAFTFGALDLAGFVLAGMLRQRLGRAPHILLEDVALALAITGGVAWALGLPVLAALDHVILALGVFLVFGRLGCLASGCCHGRPASIGIEYPTGSVPEALVGVRLFPVQAVEAAWIAIITAIAFPFAGGGDALEVWGIGYATGRFVLEWLRGDTARRRLGPLTEAQWIGLGAVLAILVLDGWRTEASTPLVAAAAAAALALVAGWLTRRWWFEPSRAVVGPGSVAAWMQRLAALDLAARQSPRHHAACEIETPAGTVAISVEHDLGDRGTTIAAYSITGAEDLAALQLIAGLIVQRRPQAHVLRASAGRSAYLVWVHDHAPAEPDVAAHPMHLVFRAQAVALALADWRDEPPPDPPRRPPDRYLQPWEPS